MTKQTTEITTLWVAKEPEEIFSQPIRAAGTFYSDMVDWTKGKRLLIKVESTLDQSVQIQLIGSEIDSIETATEVTGAVRRWFSDAALPCAPNGNISVGLGWGDWHPYIGVRITVAVAPTSGELKVKAVIQE